MRLAISMLMLILLLSSATSSELMSLSTGLIRGGALELPHNSSCRGPFPLLRAIGKYLILKDLIKPVSMKLIDIYGTLEDPESLDRGDPVLVCDGYLISTRACLLSNIVSVNESYGTMLTSSGLKLKLRSGVIGDALRARGKLATIWVDTWTGEAYRLSLNRELSCPIYPPDLMLTREGDELVLTMSWRLEGDEGLNLELIGLKCSLRGTGRRYVCNGGALANLREVKIHYLGHELIYRLKRR